MTSDDRFLLKLTGWRENRGGGEQGMQSVMNAILNRAARRGESVYDVCTDRLQFSSVTALGDAETVLFAKSKNLADWAMWQVAETLAARAEAGALPDLTGGATVYYAPRGIPSGQASATPFALPDGSTVPFPKGWNRAALTYRREIAGQLFFTESHAASPAAL